MVYEYEITLSESISREDMADALLFLVSTIEYCFRKEPEKWGIRDLDEICNEIDKGMVEEHFRAQFEISLDCQEHPILNDAETDEHSILSDAETDEGAPGSQDLCPICETPIKRGGRGPYRMRDHLSAVHDQDEDGKRLNVNYLKRKRLEHLMQHYNVEATRLGVAATDPTVTTAAQAAIDTNVAAGTQRLVAKKQYLAERLVALRRQ